MACLESLAMQDYAALHVIVVDNASTDDSVRHLVEVFPKAEIISLAENLGFAGGCNAGIRRGLAMGAEWIWLLNNDTVAPADTLTKLVAASQGERIGITGTVLYFLHEPARVQAWGGGKVVDWMGYVTHFLAPATLESNSFLTFASVLIRRELLVEVGLMDESYFMYFDDSDFCFRARRAGWNLAVASDTAVLHKQGGSTEGRKSPQMERIVTTSGLRFLGLHARVPPIAMTLFILSKLAKRLVGGDLKGIRAVVLGVNDWLRERTTVFRSGS
jgi:GT2 family glycosyltransferase